MKKYIINIPLITLAAALIICSCCLFPSDKEYRILSDKLYGRIKANGVDITEKVHSGEYVYYRNDDITFEYIPSVDLDVEFLGWYYITGIFNKQETEITDSFKINTRDIIYWNMYPKIKTPEVDLFYEDPVLQNTLLEIRKDKQKSYRYLTFKDGEIENIAPLVLDHSIYIHGVRDGKIYYSKNKIFYSYNINEDKHSVILDYSDDAVDLEFYCDTGFLLISHLDQGAVIKFLVLNIDSDQTEYYMPSTALKIGDAFLSGDGNTVIIAEKYQDDERLVRIDIPGDTSTVLIPVIPGNINTNYGIVDGDNSGETFCYYASYYRQTAEGQVYYDSGYFIYVDGGAKEINDSAYYTSGDWTQIFAEAEKTVFYKFYPSTMQYIKLITLPFYKNNVATKYIRRTGSSNFVFTTPHIEERFFAANSFSQFGFYNYNDDEIYIIPAANIIDCKVKYFQDYTK